MPLPLPNLDTRQWNDLVEEGRALIPRYAPGWTDHNIHDPGITLLDLFAWFTEQAIYRTNRVPQRHLRKFLDLIGFSPTPPQPAYTVLAFRLTPGALSQTLPQGLILTTGQHGEQREQLSFQTLTDLTVTAVQMIAIQSFDGNRFIDETPTWREGLPVHPWGANPDAEIGSALYLGFDQALPMNQPVRLWLQFAGPNRDLTARQQILEDQRQAAIDCRPQKPEFTCPPEPPPDEPISIEQPPLDDSSESSLIHHSVRTLWEYFNGTDWQALSSTAVVDDTRGFSLDGAVQISIPGSMVASTIGAIGESLFYLRCRLVGGRPDRAPLVIAAAINAVDVEQAVPVQHTFAIAPNVIPTGQVLEPGTSAPLSLMLDEHNTITALSFGENGAGPDIRILDYQPATELPDSLTVVMAFLGRGIGVSLPHTFTIAPGVTPTEGHEPIVGASASLSLTLDNNNIITTLSFGEDGIGPEIRVLDYRPATSLPGSLTIALPTAGHPSQQFTLPSSLVARGHIQVWTQLQEPPGSARSQQWEICSDFDSSTRTDTHVVLDFDNNTVTFGDGEHGRVVPENALIFAVYDATVGPLRQLEHRWQLSDNLLNQALLGNDLPNISANVETIVQLSPVIGGTETETIDRATGRAVETLWAHERLVELCSQANCETLDQLDRTAVLALKAPQRATTLLDFERIALQVPGTAVARARAWADIDPTLPCVKAPGTVALVIVPYLPQSRPQPTAGLLQAVRRHLNRKRVLGTRLVVAGPRYLEVTVKAHVRSQINARPDRVRAAVIEALNRFLDPLTGGPNQRGWPFGRDVYRAEILQVIDEVPGVDHVLNLELIPGEGEAQCGNLCVGPIWLVTPGAHSIELV